MGRSIKVSGLDIFISEKTADELQEFLVNNVIDLPSWNLRYFHKKLFTSVTQAIHGRCPIVKFCLDRNETKTRKIEILELQLIDFTLAWEK